MSEAMRNLLNELRPGELMQLRCGPMWAGAASQPVGMGDPLLERAEAAGLISRTDRGFVLTEAGRRALKEPSDG